MKLITANLVTELQELSQDAVHICWITAFVMKSGVKLMLEDLKKCEERGGEIQLLVGDYLSITQPEALRMLVENLPTAQIRMFQSYGRSFHPKAYLFKGKDSQHVIVGSSNLSNSALTSGVEWSLETVDMQTFEQAMDEFHDLFHGKNTIPINTETIAMYETRYIEANKAVPMAKKWSDSEEQGLMYGQESEPAIVAEAEEAKMVLEPRPAQKLALAALKKTLEQGYDKAMAVLATGLGKTYLAAFFAERFKRVLFVVHRDEILQQAKETFVTVYPHKTAGFFNRFEKDTDSDFIFASISTISRKYHLEKFNPADFDLIVVDEFHHAVANSYQKVLDYFKPQFLLGITATPDRLDNKDVFSICDGNVAIEIHFIDAIKRNWLSPFHYYGVKDETDYSSIRWLGSHYDEEQLTVAQTRQSFMQKVYEEWHRLKQTRTIGFCSTIRQAEQLCAFFISKDVKAFVLSGRSTPTERKTIRQQLIDGEIDIIFTVDLFNEGVDIPTVDTLLFVRPTESIAVFTQQIGRGLRVADGKSHCVIIDFIGNYRNADRKLLVFKPELLEKGGKKLTPSEQIAETACQLHFDISVIDLLAEMAKKNRNYKQQIIDVYVDLKMELGRRPSYLEMYLQSGFQDINIAREFGSYIGMLKEAGELPERELAIFEVYEPLLQEIEKTSMTRSYKMVVLYAMLGRGAAKWYKPITAEKVAPIFADYLSKPSRQAIDKIHPDHKKVMQLIQTMPMTKWSGSSKGLVIFEDGEFGFAVDIENDMQLVVFNWVKEICEYRLHRYFTRKSEQV